jgi:hypothetical protein
MSGGGGQQGAAAPAQGGVNAAGNYGQAAQGALGQAPGAQGSFAGQNQQAQSNALGAISAPAGGGQTNMMKPMPFTAGGPYGGFNAQGQNPANYQPSQEAIDKYETWKADQNRPLGPGEARQMNAMLDPRSPEAMQMQMMQANRAQQPQGQEQFQNNMMRPMPMPQPQGPISVGAFSPQSPMGGFPQQPQGAGPDVTGNSPAARMGYDQSGSDAGIGGQAVQGVQNPAGMGGKTSRVGGPYGGIMAGRPAMDQGEIPPSLSQMRPQKGGLKIQGNPTAQPFSRKGRAAQQR